VYHTCFFASLFNCFGVAGDWTSIHERNWVNLATTSQEEEEKVKKLKYLVTFLGTCFAQTHCQILKICPLLCHFFS
jgi:hypothetical protein